MTGKPLASGFSREDIVRVWMKDEGQVPTPVKMLVFITAIGISKHYDPSVVSSVVRDVVGL